MTQAGTRGPEGSAQAGAAERSPGVTAVISRFALPLAVILLCAGTLLHVAKGHYHTDVFGNALGIDDAFISFRYAKNLVDGHGLVYNPGDRVQGYSNFLYVILSAPGAFVFGNRLGLYVYAIGLNLSLAIATLYVYWFILRSRLSRPFSAIGLLLFAANPAIWLWIGAGLETLLVLLLQLSTCAMFLRLERNAEKRGDALILGAVLSLLVLSRADGFITVLCAVAFLVLKGRIALAGQVLALPALTLVAYVGWALAYYGDPLPNTYYVKVIGPIRFRVKLAVFQMIGLGPMNNTHASTLYSFIAASAPLALLVGMRFRLRPWIGRLPFEAVFAAAWLAYWLVIGGDWLGERFLLPLIAIGILYSLQLCSALSSRRAALLIALLAGVQGVLPVAADPRFAYAEPKYDRWVELGHLLSRDHADETIAVDAAGKVPFLSGLRAIDMLGLNDRHIAHLEPVAWIIGHGKFDPEYVLARQPSLIAAWVHRPTLNLAFGLERTKYSSAGYTFRYLVARRAPPPGEAAILDVRGWSEDRVRARIASGYDYGVLARSP